MFISCHRVIGFRLALALGLTSVALTSETFDLDLGSLALILLAL